MNGNAIRTPEHESQLPPLKRVAWMVTLKGSLYEYCLPQDAKNAKFTSFLFSFERKENKSYNALWQLYNSIRRYICALNDYAMIFA